METLLGVEAVGSDQNLRGLRRLYDEVESHIRSLKALGVGSESYGTMACLRSTQQTTPRRPPHHQSEDLWPRFGYRWATLSSGGRTDSQGAYTHRNATSFTSAAREGSPHSNHPPHWHPSIIRSIFLLLPQTHPSAECCTVPSAIARKQSLRASGRCFNCLRRGHLSRNCRSSGKCSRHHSSICESHELLPSKLTQSSLIQRTASPLNPEAAPFTATPTSNNMCSSNVKTVLLQTARAPIYNASDPRRSTELRLLLDIVAAEVLPLRAD